MATECYALEPFPLFVDSTSPSTRGSFSSSTMNLLTLLHPKSQASSRFRLSSSIPSKVSSYVRLRYYQYEVTFGLYVMTPCEKIILNTIVFSILAALSCGICIGLQPFMIRSVCQLVWYIFGSYEGVGEVCTRDVC